MTNKRVRKVEYPNETKEKQETIQKLRGQVRKLQKEVRQLKSELKTYDNYFKKTSEFVSGKVDGMNLEDLLKTVDKQVKPKKKKINVKEKTSEDEKEETREKFSNWNKERKPKDTEG